MVHGEELKGFAMRLEAVRKRYGVRQPWIVRDVTRDVAAGTLIRLEGRNGSGKSTLLRIAAGALLPSAGRVTGRPHAGYVPERFPAGLAPLAAGLGAALICALVGSAVGTLFNPPLIRHPAAALLCTIAAVILAWVARISPANAALRGNGALVHSAAWPTGAPLAAAVVVVAAAWTASCWLAGRRGE